MLQRIYEIVFLAGKLQGKSWIQLHLSTLMGKENNKQNPI